MESWKHSGNAEIICDTAAKSGIRAVTVIFFRVTNHPQNAGQAGTLSRAQPSRCGPGQAWLSLPGLTDVSDGPAGAGECMKALEGTDGLTRASQWGGSF